MRSIANALRNGTLLLAAASGSAAAGWVEVGGNEITVAYADSGTIRRSGNIVRMWHLLDYANARRIQGIKPYLSIKMQDEYDCAQERTRTLSMSLYSGNMGAGEVLGNVTDPGEWRQVPADTLAETLRAFACGKW
jgi:hypothetical protein